MRKFIAIFVCMAAIVACDKHDPILPGTRSDIFDTMDIRVLNTNVPNLPDNIDASEPEPCPYSRDEKNTIWNGDKKIYAGFPTTNFVRGASAPVCSGKYIYTGLSTGELVKINPVTRSLVWSADIYRTNNMTGGASLVDIVASPIVRGNYVYVGGMGDALCKLNANNGNKIWCDNISITNNFIFVSDTIFAVGSDKNLYAINEKNGDVYWRSSVKRLASPVYSEKVITVGREKINAESGELLK